MIQARDTKHLYYGMQRAAGSLAIAIFYAALAGLWSGSVWAQQTRTEFNSPVRQEIQRPHPPIGFPVTPIVFPATNPSSALGSALASCETGSEVSELSLPGARGEIKLDRCYRGRDHLVCQFNVLMGEAKYLLENSRRIVDANYPEARDVGGICAIKTDTLASDIRNALEFADRFKAVKAEYEARANCTIRIEQSIRDAALTDMSQADNLRTSMIDAFEGDVKSVSEIQGKLSQIAANMDSSQKAMVTLQKIHRAMCIGHQRTEAKGIPSQ